MTLPINRYSACPNCKQPLTRAEEIERHCVTCSADIEVDVVRVVSPALRGRAA